MGIPLLSGRAFRETDNQQSASVAIVSARTAELLWPGQSPLGRQLRWGRIESDNQWPWRTLVGVVGNVKSYAMDPEQTMELYYPYGQQAAGSFNFVIRARGRPESLASAVRHSIHAVDKDTAIVSVKTMEDIVSESIWQKRLWSVLFALFATVALLLAAVGIYGVMSYLVSQRTREIGIRMALGARRGNVLALVIGRGLMLVAVGLAVGLSGALALSQIIKSLIFGVTASDPVTFVTAPVVLTLVASIACYIPARRAARVDPVIALRQD